MIIFAAACSSGGDTTASSHDAGASTDASLLDAPTEAADSAEAGIGVDAALDAAPDAAKGCTLRPCSSWSDCLDFDES